METAQDPPWDDLRVLLALHRERSFLKAGQRLALSTSTVARRIDALESSLGRKLVHRSSGGTSLEPEALELVSLAEQLELGLSAARRDERAGEVAGTVRISCGEGFLRPVTRVLAEVRRRHPGLSFELTSEHRLVDVARREADIGIRKARVSNAVVVERPVGKLRFALYAAPSYLERRLRGGRLANADFGRHDFIGYDGPLMNSPHFQRLRELGAERFPFRTTSDFAFQEAVEAGLGIGLIAEALGDAVPSLVRLDCEPELPSLPVYLAFHQELRRVPRVRVVLQALEEAFRRALPRPLA